MARKKLSDWDWNAHIDVWETSPNEPNLVVNIRGKNSNSDQQSLMFNGHIDMASVEKSERSQWKYPPYGGTITSNRIWGRGSSDMKGELLRSFGPQN